jgi:hypothetical protein
MDERKYTLNDLSESELKTIYGMRESAKGNRQFANYFWGSMILSLLLAILLTRQFHNAYIGFLSFIPFVVFMVINYRRNRKIRQAVTKKFNEAKEGTRGHSGATQ